MHQFVWPSEAFLPGIPTPIAAGAHHRESQTGPVDEIVRSAVEGSPS